jgi:hypothetical protein
MKDSLWVSNIQLAFDQSVCANYNEIAAVSSVYAPKDLLRKDYSAVQTSHNQKTMSSSEQTEEPHGIGGNAPTN